MKFISVKNWNREGINSTGPNGCIQTAKRYYSSKANYVYTGALSPQYSGIFTTNPEADAVNNLIVSKSQISDVLVLQQPILITGRLIQQRGNINKNSFLLDQGIKKEIASEVR